MFHKAYVCPWCKKDLKSKEIPHMSKSYYSEEDTHFTIAIELFGKGFEHEKCGCRWDFQGKILKEGLEEFKNKYEIKESTIAENATVESNLESNNNSNNESEGKSNEK